MQFSVTVKCKSCEGFGFIKYESWICEDCNGKGTITNRIPDQNEYNLKIKELDNVKKTNQTMKNKLENLLSDLKNENLQTIEDVICFIETILEESENL